jgi:hypothetical protein
VFLRIFAEPTSEHVDETSSSKSHGLKSPLLLGPDIDRSATAFQFHRDLIELNEIKNEMDEARREIGRHRETLGAKQPGR